MTPVRGGLGLFTYIHGNGDCDFTSCQQRVRDAILKLMDSNDNDLLNSLKHEFGSQLDGNEALQACKSRSSFQTMTNMKAGFDICNTFKLSAESLRYKWEAMCYNSSRKAVSNSLNLENARDLRAHINREVTAAADLASKRARIPRTAGPRIGRLAEMMRGEC